MPEAAKAQPKSQPKYLGGAAHKRVLAEPVPAEGENGLFSQSWFPICHADEVPPGTVIGRDFLGGRIIVYRGESGEAAVLSAFCPHMGADLAVGDVTGDDVRCAFHHWAFDAGGRCTGTMIGDTPPKAACLFRFPTAERYGLIWAFNGEEPHWDIPDFPLPDDELSIRVRYDVPPMPCDPWVICANTPDWQHIKVVHRVDFDHGGLAQRVRWTDHSMEYSFAGRMEHGEGPEIAYNVGIYGTSIFKMDGVMDGQWYAVMTPFGLPKAGMSQNHFVTAFRNSDLECVSDDEIEFRHLMLFEFGKAFTADDRPILHSSKFRPGTLTKSDAVLSRFFDYLRAYPRANPAADFIY